MKNLIIHSGNLAIGGQEKMTIELLKVLSPTKYKVLFLIEEHNGSENYYEKEIPNYINYKFLTTETFMDTLKKYKKHKNFISKIIYSYLLKKKKKIAINNLKKEMEFADTIIDYDGGLLRNINLLDLNNKSIVFWGHLGDGGPISHQKKRENFLKYTHVVAINSLMKQGFLTNHKNSTFKVELIYNFMDETIVIDASTENIDEDLGEYIVNVGALTKVKNHKLLIEAFHKLVLQGRKEKLVLIGNGREKENIEKLIKNLNLENKVILLGRKENPFKYIKNSLFYVNTSYLEGMPLTVIEAMILKKAVICTKNSGSIEVLGNSEFGILVDHNLEKLVFEMKKMLIDKEHRTFFEKKSEKRSFDFSSEKGKHNIEVFIDSL